MWGPSKYCLWGLWELYLSFSVVFAPDFTSNSTKLRSPNLRMSSSTFSSAILEPGSYVKRSIALKVGEVNQSIVKR